MNAKETENKTLENDHFRDWKLPEPDETIEITTHPLIKFSCFILVLFALLVLGKSLYYTFFSPPLLPVYFQLFITLILTALPLLYADILWTTYRVSLSSVESRDYFNFRTELKWEEITKIKLLMPLIESRDIEICAGRKRFKINSGTLIKRPGFHEFSRAVCAIAQERNIPVKAYYNFLVQREINDWFALFERQR